MKSLLKNLILTVIIVLMVISTVSAQEFSGFFSIDTVDAYPGEPVGIPVYLHENNVNFAALALPIRYDAELLSYDSISFEGSIMPDNFTGGLNDAPDSNLMSLFYLPPFEVPTPTIDIAEGLVGTIWCTVGEQASPGFITIDSASYNWSYYLNGQWKESWIGAMMANSTGDTTWFPNCIGGGVNVLVPTSINDDIGSSLPTSFALAQNYPNPFNPETVIEYSLAQAGQVKLEVFNVLGQKVSTLVEGSKPAGNHQVEFDASIYPSGIFFYRLTQGENSQTKKMVLVK